MAQHYTKLDDMAAEHVPSTHLEVRSRYPYLDKSMAGYDWESGKPFTITTECAYVGKRCTVEDAYYLKQSGFTHVVIHYNDGDTLTMKLPKTRGDHHIKPNTVRRRANLRKQSARTVLTF